MVDGPAALRDLAATPSAEAWVALCAALDALEGAALDAAVAAVRAPLARWPATLRRADAERGPGRAWLGALTAGRWDARLELLGWAAVRIDTPFEVEGERLGAWRSVRAAYPLVVLFARALDPAFDPPDTVRALREEYTSAYGCGGGFDEEVRGDDVRGARWYDAITEHAADDSSAGAWTAVGLPAGCALSIGRWERGRGAYTFAAEGPCPQVLELAAAWAELMRPGPGVDLDVARRALAGARAPWRT